MGNISMVDYGVDLTWNNNTTLETVENEDNILQHIRNRLTTSYIELNWIYSNYGCNYRQYLGKKVDKESLEFIKNSISQSLNEDININEFDLSLSYLGNGVINIILNIDGTDFNFNLGEDE
jgi:phage baseplate assembly protein W